jgi:hypothetical protein
MAAALGGVLWLVMAFPRLADVETGRTREYPDLMPRSYALDPELVARAAKAALARLPHWTFVGAGKGPGGHQLRAFARPDLIPYTSDLTVTIHAEAGGTKVSVRSRSQNGPWDLGQNARNIRRFLAALDRELAAGGGASGAGPASGHTGVN